LLCFQQASAAPVSVNPSSGVMEKLKRTFYSLDCSSSAAYASCNNTRVSCNYDGSFLSHGQIQNDCFFECECKPAYCGYACGKEATESKSKAKTVVDVDASANANMETLE